MHPGARHDGETDQVSSTLGPTIEVDRAARRETRRQRYRVRRTVQAVEWAHNANSNVFRCGRSPIAINGADTPIAVNGETGGARFTGLHTCGNGWLCPSCAATIREHRARDIDNGVRAHLASGGGAYWVTVTVPHTKLMWLRDTYQAVQRSWSKVWAGEEGMAGRERFGVIGQIRAIEVTHGRNGWHPHIHALVLTDGPCTDAGQVALWEWLEPRWGAFVAGQGYARPSPVHGCRVDVVQGDELGGVPTLARYLAKVQEAGSAHWGAGREMARADVKRSRVKGGFTPFGIAAAIADAPRGSRHDELVNLWLEYSEATKGRAAIFWSRGLRARLLPDAAPEMSDAEAAAQPLGVEAEAVVAVVGYHLFRRVRKLATGPEDLLEAVEDGGYVGGLAWVSSRFGVLCAVAEFRRPSKQRQHPDNLGARCNELVRLHNLHRRVSSEHRPLQPLPLRPQRLDRR
jgi:hypothetical protein